MKYELEKFTKKKIKKIQSNYKITHFNKNLNDELNYLDKLKIETKKYNKALIYKNKFDKGEIKEKDIPDEFIDIVRNIYNEEIITLKRRKI